MKSEKVAILGASSKPERYSYKALKMLLENGHHPVPVSIKEPQIEGITAVKNLSEIKEPIDTVTVYVKPSILAGEVERLKTLSPRRVIFNPGTEAPEIQKELEEAGIETTTACTLVLLSTGQY